MKNVTFNRRRNYYEARLGIPAELRLILGKSEFRENLGADKKLAERNALAILNKWHMQLDEARDWLERNKPSLSTAAKAHYKQELRDDDKERLSGSTPGADIARPIYAARLRSLVNGDIGADEAEALIGYAANQIDQNQLPAVPRMELLKHWQQYS